MYESEPDWGRLFDQLAGQSIQIALVCTGGGSGAIARCFRRNGASKNFVEGLIPYSRAASDDYLGREFNGSKASKQFAQELAEVAYQRAKRLGECESSKAIGIALVAALPTSTTTDAIKQVHVALHRQDGRRCWSEVLDKGTHTRQSAEAFADQMVFRAIESTMTTN